MRVLLLVGIMGCGGGDEPEDEAPVTVEVTESSFGCVTDMAPIRVFYATNLLGDLDATRAMETAPQGTAWPVGSLIQLIPTEAMVKRESGFNEASHDWEYFSLRVDASGTEIVQRGTDDVENAAGGNCQSCHAAAQDWDLVCERDHGCVALPFSDDTIRAIQDGDPRCE
ncbi:MAG TPA: hypothetical protein PKA64_11755 [Myxococcota bacterium]|nr:hypothetical protein [Myxococcota bacterium]